MPTKVVPSFIQELKANLAATPKFIQVILGPRQVGKTTGILQFLTSLKQPHFYFSTDDLISPTPLWLEEKWQDTKLSGDETYLIIDEIQRIKGWSSVVKKLWDQQSANSIGRTKKKIRSRSSFWVQAP